MENVDQSDGKVALIPGEKGTEFFLNGGKFGQWQSKWSRSTWGGMIFFILNVVFIFIAPIITPLNYAELFGLFLESFTPFPD